MTRYRKRPVEIDAIQWDGTASGATTVINWILSHDGTASYVCSDQDRCAENDGDTPHWIKIPTLEGTMTADLGDWIIREPFPTDDRKFYPCKPDIFAATYELVEERPAEQLRHAGHAGATRPTGPTDEGQPVQSSDSPADRHTAARDDTTEETP